MKEEQYSEKLYDLVESFEFEELSEKDKSLVLQHISKNEYSNIRSTIVDANTLFSKNLFVLKKEKKSIVRRIVTYPVELYKIAAMIILFLGIGFISSNISHKSQPKVIASADTIYTHKVDTVLVEKTTTVEVVKEKIVFKDRNLPKNVITAIVDNSAIMSVERDCTKEICPGDITHLSKTKSAGNLSNDALLTEFMVSLNWYKSDYILDVG